MWEAFQHSSINVDIRETLAAWQNVDARNRAGFEREKDDLQRRGANVIVGDITPWAFVMADALGLPAFCPTNFTWADIYREYISEEPAFAPIVRELERQYNLATLLNTDLDLPMPYFSRRRAGRFGGADGANRRAELLPHLPADASQKHLAVYAGIGVCRSRGRSWPRFTDWHFITLDPRPKNRISNLTALSRAALPPQDIVASVNLVVSKPGYGLVGDVWRRERRFFIAPAPGFAEYAAMDRELTAWGGGYRRSVEDFIGLHWESVLASVLSAKPSCASGLPPAVPTRRDASPRHGTRHRPAINPDISLSEQTCRDILPVE